MARIIFLCFLGKYSEISNLFQICVRTLCQKRKTDV